MILNDIQFCMQYTIRIKDIFNVITTQESKRKKENKKTLGQKTHEGKILIYCGGNILLLRRWCHMSCVATYSSSSGVLCCDVLLLLRRLVLRRTPPPPASCVATYSSSSGVGVTRLVLRHTPPPPASFVCDVLLLLRRWCHASCVATYPSSSAVGVTRLVLRLTPSHT